MPDNLPFYLASLEAWNPTRPILLAVVLRPVPLDDAGTDS